MMKLNEGIKGILSMQVEMRHTAKEMKSGTLDVLATPALVTFVEECAWTSVQSYLDERQGTVGSSIQITHKAPTPLGGEVKCQTELIQIEGRKLTFAFTVSDSVGEVASGIHERFIIDTEKFMKKTAMRK